MTLYFQIQVYDGDSPREDVLLGMLCGSTVPGIFTSRGSDMLLMFTSIDSTLSDREHHGFQGQFWFVRGKI